MFKSSKSSEQSRDFQQDIKQNIIQELTNTSFAYTSLSYQDKVSNILSKFNHVDVISTIANNHGELDISNNVGFYKTLIVGIKKENNVKREEFIELEAILTNEYPGKFEIGFMDKMPSSIAVPSTPRIIPNHSYNSKNNNSEEKDKCKDKCKCNCKTKSCCKSTGKCFGECCKCFGSCLLLCCDIFVSILENTDFSD